VIKLNNNTSHRKNKIIDYVIIGNSAAGTSAAENIRKLDKKGSIIILTSEGYLNYSKPLITYYIAGKVSLERINFKKEEFYKCNNIYLELDSRVKHIDTIKKIVITVSGRKIHFNKLLIANGGKPIIPEIKIRKSSPRKVNNTGRLERNFNDNFISLENLNNIKGIYKLTTLEDAIKIKKYIEEKKIKSVSILGGGLIGLKSAEAFLEVGLRVNIIELSNRIMSATFDKEASDIIENIIKSKGSNVFTNDTIEVIYINKKKIISYKLRSGKKVESSLLIIAVGVKPDTSIINDDSIQLSNGITVDNFMRTTQEDVFAAGDVINSYDMVLNKERNIAIWPLAVRQGAVAGINMAGGNKKYCGGFFMNSIEILGIPSISMGMANAENDMQKNVKILKDYNNERNFYKKIIVKEDKIIGVIMIGNIERAGIYAGLIKNKIDVSNIIENINREDFGIIQLPLKYRKHMVVGEGIEV
jgi:NAD(P)H-nitrite reductase large subunit